tara:strand:- start:1258 stop:1710 length:453 start_codon:yes stop_codon:yes gene_type:complete
MKTCKKCNETKSLELFSKNKASKDGKQVNCKACNKAHKASIKEETKAYGKVYYNIPANKAAKKASDKAYYEAKKLPYHIVYALPDFRNDERAYCGVTDNPHYRMARHKQQGNNTQGWFILGVFVDREEALIAEDKYHEQGYCGAKHWEKS